MEASVAAAETVIMETDFSVAVKLASFCITLQLAMHTNNVDIYCVIVKAGSRSVNHILIYYVNVTRFD